MKTTEARRGRPSHREELLTTALDLFSAAGVRNTTVRDITHQAGVTEAALYRHWRDKQSLAKEVFDQAAAELTARLEEARNGEEDPRRQLERVVDAFFTYYEIRPRRFQLLVHQAHLEPEILARCAFLPRGVLLAILSVGIAGGHFVNIKPDLAAALVTGTVARTTQFLAMKGQARVPLSAAQAVKEMILRALCPPAEAPAAALPCSGPTERRPWGSFTVLLEEQGHKVKRIQLLPGRRLSLQRHRRRSEHWQVVQGRARVTVGELTLALAPGGTVDIPRGAIHRVENPGREELIFVEIQRGSYLGEDDIERLEDDFGRC